MWEKNTFHSQQPRWTTKFIYNQSDFDLKQTHILRCLQEEVFLSILWVIRPQKSIHIETYLKLLKKEFLWFFISGWGFSVV